MKYQFDHVITRTGDLGKSSNFDGDVLPKNHSLFETVGTIDELSSWIGLIRRSFLKTRWARRLKLDSVLKSIQEDLQDIMSLIATDPKFDSKTLEPTNERYINLEPVQSERIVKLEDFAQSMVDHGLIIQESFVLPSGEIDVARTVCRRAERCIVRYMSEQQSANRPRFDLNSCSVYLNRLSDVLFFLARHHDQFGDA